MVLNYNDNQDWEIYAGKIIGYNNTLEFSANSITVNGSLNGQDSSFNSLDISGALLSSTTITVQSSDISYNITQLGSDIMGDNVSDRFGHTVSISSDGTIISAGSLYANSNTGYVKVYNYTDGSWVQMGQTLHGLETGDGQGVTTLSSNGLIVATSAYNNDTAGSNRGLVRIFQYTDNSWIQMGGNIYGDDNNDYFSPSLAISYDGTILAVGAYYSNGNRGEVNVYNYNDTSWVKMGLTVLSGNAAYDWVGHDVALSSDGLTIAIGSRIYTINQVYSELGLVQIFKYINSSWEQIGQDIYGEAISTVFGNNVSLSSDGTILAAGGNAVHGGQTGHVKIYKYIDSSWVQLGGNIYGSYNQNFGWKVSLSSDGSIVAISAYNAIGYVIIYKYTDSSWIQIGTTIVGEAANDNFGWSMELSSDGLTVVAGSENNDDNGTSSGDVKVYKLGDYLSEYVQAVSCNSCIVNDKLIVGDNNVGTLTSLIVSSGKTTLQALEATDAIFANVNISQNLNVLQDLNVTLDTVLQGRLDALDASFANVDMNGNITGGNNSILSVASGNDTTHTLGNAKIGHMVHNGYAGISHIDCATTTKYALIQNSDGVTLLNSAPGQRIYLQENNTQWMFGSSAGVTITPALTVNGNISIGAATTYFYPIGSTELRTHVNGILIQRLNGNSNGTFSQNMSYATQNLYTGGAWTSFSDDRLKHNEYDIINGLDMIRLLTPQRYQRTKELYDADYNGDISGYFHEEAGFIAQDVMKIPDLSFAVGGGDYIDESGNIIPTPYNLRYHELFVFNMAATKELDSIVTTQAATISTLEAKLAAQEAKIATQDSTITELSNNVNLLQQENASMKTALNELLAAAGKPII
jgi:uncharacterized coiled-coil protein SlyX